MEIRIKKVCMNWSYKRELKSLGFKIRRDWRTGVYVLTAPSNIYLQKSTFCYFIITTEGKHLGHIAGEPLDPDGALLIFVR